VTVQLLFRFIGMVVFGTLGWRLGVVLAGGTSSALREVLALALLLSALGLVVAPWLSIYPYRRLRDALRKAPAEDLISVIIGLVIGLIMSALLSFPLGLLSSPWREILAVAVTAVLCYASIATILMRRDEITSFLNAARSRRSTDNPSGNQHSVAENEQVILLDTSAIIDGRIADVSQTGFILRPLVVPRFILNELQHIADSHDTLRRNRGRRGLEMLGRLQRDATTPVRIVDYEMDGPEEVDAKLITLAKKLDCPILTNDLNLYRVARLQGISSLNMNELANAVKTTVLPGEPITVQVIQEGKEMGQGVGYLDDGTMVVVEQGRRYINQTVNATVTKVLQTAAGRMIFAELQ